MAPGCRPAGDQSALGTVPHATRADLDDALAAAEQGFKLWSRTSPAKRAEIIFQAVRLMRERVEDMAIAMTLEQGKPIAQSRLEIIEPEHAATHDVIRSPHDPPPITMNHYSPCRFKISHGYRPWNGNWR
jgi:hypothetical protein